MSNKKDLAEIKKPKTVRDLVHSMGPELKRALPNNMA